MSGTWSLQAPGGVSYAIPSDVGFEHAVVVPGTFITRVGLWRYMKV